MRYKLCSTAILASAEELNRCPWLFTCFKKWFSTSQSSKLSTGWSSPISKMLHHEGERPAVSSWRLSISESLRHRLWGKYCQNCQLRRRLKMKVKCKPSWKLSVSSSAASSNFSTISETKMSKAARRKLFNLKSRSFTDQITYSDSLSILICVIVGLTRCKPASSACLFKRKSRQMSILSVSFAWSSIKDFSSLTTLSSWVKDNPCARGSSQCSKSASLHLYSIKLLTMPSKRSKDVTSSVSYSLRI